MSEIRAIINEAKVVAKMRGETYQWFTRIFANELTESDVRLYQEGALNTLLELFTEIGLALEVDQVKAAIERFSEIEHISVELRADFASCFLLDDKSGAIPYASLYLGDGDMMYAEAERKMRELLSKSGLAILDSFKEPSDHLAIYLALLQKWCEQLAKDLEEKREDHSFLKSEYIAQQTFLQEGLLLWVPIWNERLQGITHCRCTFYSAMGSLLVAYLLADNDYLTAEIERLIALEL